MKPSIFKQVAAVPVAGRELMESPRHWNCGLIRYRNRLWMSYRFHLKDAGGRCATAIVELGEKTFLPIAKSQHLKLSGPTGSEHHEDARLFLFNGKVHISYTEMRGYVPGVDYTCVMRYAELKLVGNRWSVAEVYQPRFGANDGRAKEKNWVFFEHDHRLHCVYSTGPEHKVLELDKERVKNIHASAGCAWQWGHLRGGTPPVLRRDGTYLSIFHSSLPTEIAPNYVRYYAGAYIFESKPPFAPVRISTRPLMAGSEEDGHQVDPRYVAGWKPYVVFPCGLVDDGDQFLVSIGVNDWQCAVATIRADSLCLGAADGSDIEPRYFHAANASRPVKVTDADNRMKQLEWKVARANAVGAPEGFMCCEDPREAQDVSEISGVTEITADEFGRATRGKLVNSF